MKTELHDELVKRMDEEQELRSEWVERPDDAQLIARMQETDLQNTTWLEKIIEAQGLPGINDVGDAGTQALFLLIQHSLDLEFQKRCLALMEALVRQDEFAGVHLAYLTDRILALEGKPQIYGTQGRSQENGVIVPYLIEDEEHVNERRQALGLESMEEYFKEMNEMYKTKK
ncbi:MAG TPA: DUF6624 domain-containing protein [Anaerolineales bacterium]|jgi:uncharacterized protein DUF6624|nr:DUF6624 domain-containing protein [Anaerolineales bacterium]